MDTQGKAKALSMYSWHSVGAPPLYSRAKAKSMVVSHNVTKHTVRYFPTLHQVHIAYVCIGLTRL